MMLPGLLPSSESGSMAGRLEKRYVQDLTERGHVTPHSDSIDNQGPIDTNTKRTCNSPW